MALLLRGALADFLKQLTAGPPRWFWYRWAAPICFATIRTRALALDLQPSSHSELAAVRALFGEIPIRGRSPVTIPGISALGDGIQRQATRIRR